MTVTYSRMAALRTLAPTYLQSQKWVPLMPPIQPVGGVTGVGTLGVLGVAVTVEPPRCHLQLLLNAQQQRQ
jgi:hypothetical protein